MTRRTLESAGFYLHYLWDQRQQLGAQAGLDDAEFAARLRTLSTFQLTALCGAPAAPAGPAAQITALYRGLLQRGRPTLPSLLVERSLLRAADGYGLAEEQTNAAIGAIQFRPPQQRGLLFDSWSDLLTQAHQILIPQAVSAPPRAGKTGARPALEALLQDPMGRLALQVVLAPFGVARIQAALLSALESSLLSLDAPRWRLVVVENDVRCATLALVDFQQHLSMFYDLLRWEARPPRIDLVVHSAQDFAEVDAGVSQRDLHIHHIQARTVGPGEELREPAGAADLLIQVTVLPRPEPSVTAPAVIAHHLDEGGAALLLEPVAAAQDTRRVAAIPPITYDADWSDGRAPRALRFFLQNIFRKQEFRPKQLDILQRALARQPVIGLLPTGAGKSLCYQLAALLQPGMTLVVAPLVSLMADQIDNLQNDFAIDWVDQISSWQDAASRQESARDLAEGRVKLLFMAPERLQNSDFRARLSAGRAAFPVPYAVIDEAHCVSEWGHDFRTAYVDLAAALRRWAGRGRDEPTLLALTGTASFAVLADIQRELGMQDEAAHIYPDSFDRPELSYRVVAAPSSQKEPVLIDLLTTELPAAFHSRRAAFYTCCGDQTHAGVIFTPHAKGPYGALNLSRVLGRELGQPVGCFTGQNDREAKAATLAQFKRNKFALLVATKAFGMGVDKPNIRYTVHTNLPPSLEAFYQEAGRAGRDRAPACCWLIFSDDFARQMDAALAPDAPEEVVAATAAQSRSDVGRLLYLHANVFRGQQAELETIEEVYKALYREVRTVTGQALAALPSGEKVEVTLAFSSAPPPEDAEGEAGEGRTKDLFAEQAQRAMALYRLGLLGVVRDYTVDYGRQAYTVQVAAQSDGEIVARLQAYLARYKTPEAVEAAAAQAAAQPGDTVLGQCAAYLLSFVYGEVEKKRRAAIRSMVEVARKAAALTDPLEQDRYVRGEVLAYLEKSPFTAALEALSQRLEPDDWLSVLKLSDAGGAPLLAAVDGARQLVGGCRRSLESHLDHPGLLYLSSIGRLLLPQPDVDFALAEARRAFRAMAQLDPEIGDRASVQMLAGYDRMLRKQSRGLQIYLTIAAIALEENPSRELARRLSSLLPQQSRRVLINLVLAEVAALNQRLQLSLAEGEQPGSSEMAELVEAAAAAAAAETEPAAAEDQPIAGQADRADLAVNAAMDEQAATPELLVDPSAVDPAVLIQAFEIQPHERPTGEVRSNESRRVETKSTETRPVEIKLLRNPA